MVQLHVELEQERSKNSALKSEIAKVRVQVWIICVQRINHTDHISLMEVWISNHKIGYHKRFIKQLICDDLLEYLLV